MFNTLSDIRKANKDAAFDFFAPDDLYYWGTRFPEGEKIYGGRFFITSDLVDIGDKDGPRRYTVREADPESGRVHSYGDATKHTELSYARAAVYDAMQAEKTKAENRAAWAALDPENSTGMQDGL